MNSSSKHRIVSLLTSGLLAAAIAGPGGVAYAAKPGGGTTTSTITAQSIWTNFKASGSSATFGYTDTETYAFNQDVADEYYVMTTTGPVATCTGSSSNCADSNKPSAPSAPTAPLFPMDRNDECSFWSGSELTTVSTTKSITINGTNGNGRFTFTWTYTWTPTSTPAAGTAWNLMETASPGGASVTFTGQVAGLSAQKTSKTSAPKYSFSLLNGDGTARVSGVTVSVDGVMTNEVASTVVDALDAGFADFSIGSGGLETLLQQSGTTSILVTGDARTILNNDSFAGNDNGGSGGDALAYAQLSAVKLLLTEGGHTVKLSAVIKGVSGSADVIVSVSRDVRVQGLGNCN